MMLRCRLASVRLRKVIQATAVASALLVTSSANLAVAQTTRAWDGGVAGTGTGFDTAANWVGDANPSVSAGDTAQFNGATGAYTGGALSLAYAGGLGGAAGNPGFNISLTSLQTNAVSLDSGGVTLSMRLNAVTIAAGAGAVTFGDSAGAFNFTMGGAGGQTHTWTNNSSN